MPFGRSFNATISQFFYRKVLILEKKNDAELGGSKISHGVFVIQNIKIFKQIVNDPLT